MAFEESPDLILLDLGMPHVDGLEVLEKMRSDEWGKELPIILFTNLPLDTKLEKKILKYKPTYYFAKSEVSLDKLIEKVKESIK